MPVQNISSQEFQELYEKAADKLEIIDVREAEEFAAAHVQGSKLIPMNEVEERLDEIDWHKEVVFVCRSGSRSGMMANLVAAQHGKTIKNLSGGVGTLYARHFAGLKVDEKLVGMYL
ncbi:rhodanese-like domain-containing protein [Patescibacteria group bacterium]|nr:MAG: rhodanese-like domain-containing protein [Patescibacteria group bacterium]